MLQAIVIVVTMAIALVIARVVVDLLIKIMGRP